MATGPKASSVLSFAVRGTFSSSVASSIAPSRLPPHRIVAPPARGFLAIQLSRRVGFLHVDHRADEGRFVARDCRRSAWRVLATSRSRKAGINSFMDDDALHPDARLARLVKGAKHGAFGSVFEIGILVDDHRGIAAEFEHDLLLAGARLQIPADIGRAGEADSSFNRSSVVNRSAPSRCAGRIEKAPAGRSVSASTSPMMMAPSGVRDAGFITNGQPTAIAGAILWAARFKRKIERRNETARPDRHALPHPLIALGARRNIERLHLAGHPHAFFGGDAEGVDQPADFAARIADRLAGLDAQRIGQFFEALGEARHAMRQHGLAFIGRHLRHRLGGRNRGGDGAIDGGGIGHGDPGRGLRR